MGIFRGQLWNDIHCTQFERYVRELYNINKVHFLNKSVTFNSFFLGYDRFFVLQYLHENARKPPQCIFNGAQILCIQVEEMEIKFIDSLAFIPSRLAAWPKMFGHTEMRKSLFNFYKCFFFIDAWIDVGRGHNVKIVYYIFSFLFSGYFPHFFNKECNESYVGELPDPEYYDPDSFSEGDCLKFYEWYNDLKA